MKKHHNIPFLFLMIVLFSQLTSEKKFTVSGQVFLNAEYCMGVRPTEEMIAELNTLKAYPNKTFFIKKGKANLATQKVIGKVKTNPQGKFTIQLPAGTYHLFDTVQLLTPSAYIKLKGGKDNYELSDSVCYKKWQNKPIASFTIKNKEVKIKDINFRIVCYKGDFNCECVDFIGPRVP